MPSKRLDLVAAALPLIFTTLSLAFVITSFVSADWVRQSYFPASLQPLDWQDPLYTLHRSPFVVCGATASKPDSNTTQYDITCARHKVVGRGQTACQTPNETTAYSDVTGDWRMCQQIHFSGNLALASLVFVCIGFASVLVLSAAIVSKALRGPHSEHASVSTADEPAAASKRSRFPAVHGTWLRLAAYWVITVLSVTALCAFLSQFYGILGLVQSQPDNGIWASLSLGAVQDQQTGDLSHAPWVQGQVLTVHLSLAWFFSALACGAVAAGWAPQGKR